MKAAILTELKKPLVVAEVGLPDSLDVGQVLVKIHYSGICGSQLGEIDGAKGPDRYLPHLLGHEGSGTVMETGPGVRHVKPGDRVVLHWRKGAGIEASAPSYTWDGRTLSAGWVTTFNEYAVVSENRLTSIPADSDLEVAALFGCAVTTGMGVIHNNAKLRTGESVVIYGAGGVGLSVVQAAALVTAHPVIAVDLHDNRLELARQLGATHLVNAAREDAAARIREITASQGVDVFIDNTGLPRVIEAGYRLVNAQGRVVLVGVPKSGNDISIHSLPLHFGKVISGSHGGETIPERDIPRYHALFKAGRLKLRELLTDRCRLEDINEAIGRMRDGRISGRCLIALSPV
jgi:S-(hydroxymethyl)glutathione dehydrogenase/alcohol dehydrogenase